MGKTILELFDYLLSKIFAFIEKGTIFKLWNPFLNFLEKFRKYIPDNKFELVKYASIVLCIIVITLIFRITYCKLFLKEDFKNEFTYLKDCFQPDAFLLKEYGQGIEFDYGTKYFIFITIGCFISIALTFIGILIYSQYLIVSISLFIISDLIMIIVIKTNINELGMIKGIIFTMIYTAFLIITNVVYIICMICFYFLILFLRICILMIMSIPVIADLAKDSDAFEDYGTTFHDYNNNQRGDYKCEGKDAFGNIILKDKDGNEILARKDKDGDVRRLDNYRHLD